MSNTNAIESQIDDLIAEDDELNLDNSTSGSDEGGEDSQDQEENSILEADQGTKTPETRDPKREKEGPQEAKPKQVAGDLVDARGNVVDKEGNILAKAGAERRQYVENRQLKARTENLTLENQQLTQRLQQAQTFADLPKQLGMTPEEYGDGLKLMKLFGQDPVAAAKEVVARVMAMGHNASDILGKDVGDSIDMRALRVRDEDLAARPARERAEAERRTQEQQTEVLKSYNAFVSEYPDSGPHEDAIAHLMTAQGIRPEIAYFRIKSFALENGLDFSKPLAPQIEARAQANLGKSSNDQPSGNRKRPMGGNGGGRVRDDQLTDKAEMADADSSWGDILKQVMQG